MRILFLSAFYPPYVIGGWEQLVQEVNIRLQARGHTTHVLTSRLGCDSGSCAEEGVERALHLDNDLTHYQLRQYFWRRTARSQQNRRIVAETVRRFAPDVAFVHVMWNLSKSVPWMAEQMLPNRVVYYVANDWPYRPDTDTSYWSEPASRALRRPIKRLLSYLPLWIAQRESRQYALQFRHVLCVSNAVRQELATRAGIAPERMQVVYNGIDFSSFTSHRATASCESVGSSFTLLYAGSLVPAKGVHTAIEAVGLLVHERSFPNVTLTIVGSGHHDYECYLHQRVRHLMIDDKVVFRPWVPREEMPGLLSRFDALVFPSEGEGLPRIVQEAMAAQTVVIGTTVGGTQELLVDNVTGLTFEPGDAATLATRIQQLAADPALWRRLIMNAYDTVHRQFGLDRMIDEVETYLKAVVEGTKDVV